MIFILIILSSILAIEWVKSQVISISLIIIIVIMVTLPGFII